jgi:hypothetical protein
MTACYWASATTLKRIMIPITDATDGNGNMSNNN